MPDVVISVRGVSKRYVRGPDQSFTVWKVAVAALLDSFRRLRGRGPRSDQQSQGREPFWALKDISFDVRRGERVGIIGRNGAGKSTLLKILSRIVYPTEGEARIRGRVMSLIEIGTGFNPDLSGRENIYLNASLYGLERREIDARFEDIVEFSGVRDFLDTPVKHYSSGMFVRLAFSVAAQLDPDILLLDEVLAVGDLSFQQRCLQRMEGLTSQGRTILFVSHSLEAVARFCDRCFWLDRGRVVMDGPVTKVIEAYVEGVLGMQSNRQWVKGASAVDHEPGAAMQLSSSAEVADAGREPGKSEVGDGLVQVTSRASENSGLAGGERPVASGTQLGSDPPGDEYVRLVSARIINSQRVTVSSVAIDEPVGVEVVYDILKAGKNSQPALHFMTPLNSYAFVVAYTDPKFMRGMGEVGRYMATAWVPPNFLNAGVLYVAVAINTPDPMERHCRVERALSFSVYERFGGADGTARGLYTREFPGVVRPLLRWETQPVEGAEVKHLDSPTSVSSDCSPTI
jgi:lipopolysaccharide transport system ATP-binding protein